MISLGKFFFAKSKDSLAIDIGFYSIKVLYLKRAGGSYSLVKWGLLPFDLTANEASPAEKKNAAIALLSKFLSAEKMSVKNVITSVSGNQVIVRHAQLNKMPREVLKQAIALEAEPFIPFDKNEVDLGFHILPQENEQPKMDTLLVIAKKELTRAKLEIFNALKLKTIIIDVDPFAVANAYELNSDRSANETVLIANIGAAITHVSIVSNHILRVVRDIPMAGNLFTNAVMRAESCDKKTAEKLKADNIVIVFPGDREKIAADENKLRISSVLTQAAKELLSEIQKAIDYYLQQKGDNAINRVLLCGGGANLNGLDKYLYQQLKIPAEIFNPFAAIAGGEDVPLGTATEFSVAVGLGMRRYGDM